MNVDDIGAYLLLSSAGIALSISLFGFVLSFSSLNLKMLLTQLTFFVLLPVGMLGLLMIHIGNRKRLKLKK